MRGRTLLTVALTLGLLLAMEVPGMAGSAHHDDLLVLPLQETRGDLQRTAIYTMRPDGTHKRRITRPAWGQADHDAAWSPDRRSIAFSRDDGQGNFNIFTVRVDGSRLRQLTHCVDTVEAPCGKFTPVWTPDGSHLVITDCCVPDSGGFLQNLAVMRTDGTRVRQLTRNPDLDFGDQAPTVSPDGKWVAFSRFVRDPEHPDSTLGISALFNIRLDGTDLRQLTAYDLIVDEKDWSPDGKRIIFTSHVGSNDGPFVADLYTIRPNGTGLRRLTFNTPGEQASFYPTYSPDGRRIVFGHFPGVGDCADLVMMNADGGHVRPVTRTPDCESQSDWGT